MARRASLVDRIVASVDGGVARSIDDLVRDVLEVEPDDLATAELAELDEALFTCEGCGWTMPRDEESDDEPDMCRECSGDDDCDE